MPFSHCNVEQSYELKLKRAVPGAGEAQERSPVKTFSSFYGE